MMLLFIAFGIQIVIENNRGVDLSQADQMQSAIQHFEGVAVNVPDSIEAQYNLASSWLIQGEYQKARDIFLYLLQRDQLGELVGSIHYNLGIAEFRLQNYQEAVDSFRTVLLLHPNNNDARYNYELALHYLNLKTSTPVPTTTGVNENPNPIGTDTPTPQDSLGSEGGATPTPVIQNPNNAPSATPNDGGQGENQPNRPTMTSVPSDNLSQAEAESLLDDAYEQQKVLSDDSILYGTPSGALLNDW
ncbi:MAG: tetratricopeptide repeat protein [Phototrophicaceae bacterium]